MSAVHAMRYLAKPILHEVQQFVCSHQCFFQLFKPQQKLIWAQILNSSLIFVHNVIHLSWKLFFLQFFQQAIIIIEHDSVLLIPDFSRNILQFHNSFLMVTCSRSSCSFLGSVLCFCLAFRPASREGSFLSWSVSFCSEGVPCASMISLMCLQASIF